MVACHCRVQPSPFPSFATQYSSCVGCRVHCPGVCADAPVGRGGHQTAYMHVFMIHLHAMHIFRSYVASYHVCSYPESLPEIYILQIHHLSTISNPTLGNQRYKTSWRDRLQPRSTKLMIRYTSTNLLLPEAQLIRVIS